jgi:hypothetical protein
MLKPGGDECIAETIRREVAAKAAATSSISEATPKVPAKFLDRALGQRSIPSPGEGSDDFNLGDATRTRDKQDALAVISREE